LRRRALLLVKQQPLADFFKAEAKAAAAQDQRHARHLARAVEPGAAFLLGLRSSMYS
jgi:hypothetical protein